MQLLSQVDPRDNLQKATRFELVDFAKANGIAVPEDAPAIYTMKILRARGLTNIKVPDRPLGLYANSGETLTETNSSAIVEGDTPNADDDLIRQYEAQKKQPDVSQLTMGELRVLCKSRGIKMARTDTMQTLKEKLSGQQNAA